LDKSIRETIGTAPIVTFPKVLVGAALTVLLLYSLLIPSASALDIEAILITGLKVNDLNGEELQRVQASHQVVIENSLKNLRMHAFDEPPVLIVEIRDSDGFTIFLSWQGVNVIEPSAVSSSSISWLVPDTAKAGDQYEMRVFALSSLVEPTALTHIYTRVIRAG
jgi:hypothetical protein